MYQTIATWTPLLIPAFILLDYVVQRRRYTKSQFWRTRALFVNIAIFFFTGQVAVFWSNLLDGYSLLNLEGLGTFGGAAFGILVYEFLHYWYHRAVHQWG